MRIREDRGKIVKRSLCGEVEEFTKYKEEKLRQLQGNSVNEDKGPQNRRVKKRATMMA